MQAYQRPLGVGPDLATVKLHKPAVLLLGQKRRADSVRTFSELQRVFWSSFTLISPKTYILQNFDIIFDMKYNYFDC